MKGANPDPLAKMDAQTAALYSTHVAPHLATDEKVLFVARWNPTKFFVTICVGVLLFGGSSLFFYFTYYIYDTMQEACGPDFNPTCRRNYRGSSWLVFLSGMLSAYCILQLGWIVVRRVQQLYVVTTKNLILVGMGFVKGKEVHDLMSLRFHRGITGLNVFCGGRRRILFMDWPSLIAFETCLENATKGVSP